MVHVLGDMHNMVADFSDLLQELLVQCALVPVSQTKSRQLRVVSKIHFL